MGTKVVNQTGFTLLAGGVSHLINKHNVFFYLCVSSFSKTGNDIFVQFHTLKVRILNLCISLGSFSLQI